MQEKDHTQQYARKMFSIPNLCTREERRLIAAWQQTKDLEARNRVLMANMKIAVAVASQHRRFGVAYEELITLGTLGLLVALDRFDLNHPGPNDEPRHFGSYAWYWTRAFISQTESTSWHIVCGGPMSTRWLFRLRKAIAKAQLFYGSDSKAIAEYVQKSLEIPLRTAEDWIAVVEGYVVSLDKPTHQDDDSSSSMKDDLRSNDLPADLVVDNKIVSEKVKNKLRRFYIDLSPRNKRIFNQRIAKEDPIRVDDLARLEKVTPQRIRQLEQVLRSKLRRLLREEAEMVGIDTQEFYERFYTKQAFAVTPMAA